MGRKFWKDADRVHALGRKVRRAANDMDAHRIHAHGLIDSMLEDGEITWQKAKSMKREWDKRHGY